MFSVKCDTKMNQSKKLFINICMSDGVERWTECEVVGKAGQGCYGVERGGDCEAIGRVGLGYGSHIRL